MVTIKIGNILDCTEDILVHQVNVQGIMGGGVARQLADKFDFLEENYGIYCDEKENKFENLRGDTFFYISNKIIANLFSQKENFDTDYKAMEHSLNLVKDFAKLNKKTIAIPYGIGCGIANGKWEEVYKIIDNVFHDFDVTLYKLRTSL